MNGDFSGVFVDADFGDLGGIRVGGRRADACALCLPPLALRAAGA